MKATAEDLTAVCDLVNELCGIALDGSKGYLVESRLAELARTQGCRSYLELVKKTRLSHDRVLRNQIVDAITTNETLFFRDQSPFEALRHKVLPEVIDSKEQTTHPRRLRLWSAACSTGQEVYSLAMVLCDMLPDVHRWDVQILGTDISDAAVARASRGWFPMHEVTRGLPPREQRRFFKPEAGGLRVTDELRSLVRFEKRNLLEPFSAMNARFDVIFCRNVAIYFEPPKRRDLFLRLARALTPKGYLFVGSQETLRDLGPAFQPQMHCRAAVYRPNQHQSASAR